MFQYSVRKCFYVRVLCLFVFQTYLNVIYFDLQVLRFYCVWDDRDSMFGEMRPFVLHFFLVDDTVEIREVHKANDGHDPFPVLVRRQRLPKDRDNIPRKNSVF